jgi:hypothetical protein
MRNASPLSTNNIDWHVHRSNALRQAERHGAAKTSSLNSTLPEIDVSTDGLVVASRNT